jgi:hypothetical protein
MFGIVSLGAGLSDVFMKSALKFKLYFLFFIVILLLLLPLFYSDLSGFIENRYFGRNADISDSFRDEMRPVLLTEISRHPIIGGGIGSYSESLIRFVDTPWNYELQWLSFVMHFGVIGVSIILLLLFSFFMNCFIRKKTIFINLSLLYFLWLMTGLFNCFLLNSSAGVVFLLFFTTIWFPNNTELVG